MNSKLEEVLELKQQLNELGYQAWQLDMIIQDALGSHLINENSQEQIEQVTKILQGYVDFAADKSLCR